MNGPAKTSTRGKSIFEQGTINKTLVKENPCSSGNQFQEDTKQKNPVGRLALANKGSWSAELFFCLITRVKMQRYKPHDDESSYTFRKSA